MSLGIQSIISTQTRSDIFQLPLSEDINTGDLFIVEQVVDLHVILLANE